MTALEFKLLAAFVRNQGRLLNRTQLLDLVWGTGTCVTDRVVDNHVVSLCRKIEPDATQKRDVFVLALADLREWPLITHPANDQMVG